MSADWIAARQDPDADVEVTVTRPATFRLSVIDGVVRVWVDGEELSAKRAAECVELRGGWYYLDMGEAGR